jgi:Domain of unknown function (DUF5710)
MNSVHCMQRIYLRVAPEDSSEVQALGAQWDDASKSWYVAAGSAPVAFARWLDEGDQEVEFNISSDEALVATANTPCTTCHRATEVICIFCQSGLDAQMGDPMVQFTVSNIWAMNDALAKQLERWPSYGQVAGEDYLANHCQHCGAVQEDYLLHSEPDDVFFGIAPDRSATVEFTPLQGRVQMSGDYSLDL